MKSVRLNRKDKNEVERERRLILEKMGDGLYHWNVTLETRNLPENRNIDDFARLV